MPEEPRVKCCSEHGVVTVAVPWAEPGSGFTALFEALVIDWLKEASVQAVSRRIGLSWNAIDGIMFHVAKYLGDAVDKVRRVEHKALCAEGQDDLTGTKHQRDLLPSGWSGSLSSWD